MDKLNFKPSAPTLWGDIVEEFERSTEMERRFTINFIVIASLMLFYCWVVPERWGPEDASQHVRNQTLEELIDPIKFHGLEEIFVDLKEIRRKQKERRGVFAAQRGDFRKRALESVTEERHFEEVRRASLVEMARENCPAVDSEDEQDPCLKIDGTNSPDFVEFLKI